MISERAAVLITGAQVTTGTRGVVSDVSGRFRLTGLTGDSAKIVFIRRLGFAPVTEGVRVGATGIQVRMSERAVELNSMVVTGTPGAVSKREVGVSIAQIAAADVVKTQPVQDVQGRSNGRAPRVTALDNSGVVGGGATVRIRGGSSLSLSNDPLIYIYIDGVRVDNAQGCPARRTCTGECTARKFACRYPTWSATATPTFLRPAEDASARLGGPAEHTIWSAGPSCVRRSVGLRPVEEVSVTLRHVAAGPAGRAKYTESSGESSR